MAIVPGKSNALASVNNCGVCGQALVYSAEPRPGACMFCGRQEQTLIYCPAGHYICDSCHSRAAIDILRGILASTDSSEPMSILERVMAHPSVPMHGPEHHAMVPGIIVASVRNAGYEIGEKSIDRAIERASKVPGGWCGFYGDCGAAVGVGIAVSVLTQATPLTGRQRSLALAATAFALERMLDDQPRCCKRASRIAVGAAVDFLKDRLGIVLSKGETPRCTYTHRNQQCAKQECPFFSR